MVYITPPQEPHKILNSRTWWDTKKQKRINRISARCKHQKVEKVVRKAKKEIMGLKKIGEKKYNENSEVGKMRIRFSERILEGEENSRKIVVGNLGEENLQGKKVYLEFEKPNGAKYLTEYLEPNEKGEIEYVLPYSLLDESGVLKCQGVIIGDGYTKKSEVEAKFVACSIKATEKVANEKGVLGLLNMLKIDGDGTQALFDDGTYKQIKMFEIKKVDKLPTEDIEKNVVYLVPIAKKGGNGYEEYIYVNGKWEIIGTTQVNLEDYYTIEQVDEKLANLQVELMKEVTYDELVALRDNGQLVVGQQYRIIDYETYPMSSSDISAGHQFDVVVMALTENRLSEDAKATFRDGDTYFNGDIEEIKIYDAEFKENITFEDIEVLATITIDGEGVYEGLKNHSDLIVEIDYITHPNGKKTPIFYKNGEGYEEEGTDYDDIFKYEGTYELEGEIYDLWHKYENNVPSVYYALTNKAVNQKSYSIDYIQKEPKEDVTKWSLKYSLDIPKQFGSVTHKGLILEMTDANGNTANYDFKNMMFKRMKLIGSGLTRPKFNNQYLGASMYAGSNFDENDYKYFYTFSAYNENEEIVDTSHTGGRIKNAKIERTSYSDGLVFLNSCYNVKVRGSNTTFLEFCENLDIRSAINCNFASSLMEVKIYSLSQVTCENSIHDTFGYDMRSVDIGGNDYDFSFKKTTFNYLGSIYGDMYFRGCIIDDITKGYFDNTLVDCCSFKGINTDVNCYAEFWENCSFYKLENPRIWANLKNVVIDNVFELSLSNSQHYGGRDLQDNNCVHIFENEYDTIMTITTSDLKQEVFAKGETLHSDTFEPVEETRKTFFNVKIYDENNNEQGWNVCKYIVASENNYKIDFAKPFMVLLHIYDLEYSNALKIKFNNSKILVEYPGNNHETIYVDSSLVVESYSFKNDGTCSIKINVEEFKDFFPRIPKVSMLGKRKDKYSLENFSIEYNV